jgi:hypothetical protein
MGDANLFSERSAQYNKEFGGGIVILHLQTADTLLAAVFLLEVV